MSHFVPRAIPLSVRFTSGGAKEILARDRARAQKIIAGKHPHGPVISHTAKKLGHHRLQHQHHQATGTTFDKASSVAISSGDQVDVTDSGVTYTLPVGVGSPPTTYTLLIDTGSSNTWVGANTKYVPTKTSKNTKKAVKVSYGSGSFSGTEYTDQVTLGPDLVINNQSIGVASTATGFTGVDGILGIGPVDLTEGTVTGVSDVPTVCDNLSSQGTISTDSIGIFYAPSSTTDATNGELTFGGTDSTKFTGSIGYVPISKTSPASHYWGIDQTVTYGTDTTLLTSSGIVDTGTTLLLLATSAFDSYQQATGGVLDQATGLLKITEEQYNNLQSLFFNIGGTTYELTPNAQIWPRALNGVLGGDANAIYLVTADMGSNLGTGLDFINGFVFLQRFYSVYDTTNTQVGLATTQYTTAETN